jgi:uncharacterized protein YfcZ (UPF0381/DUF406 family)
MVSIYLIEDINDLKYIGSTKQKLTKRFNQHKTSKKINRPCSSKQLNLHNCIIYELEKCDDINRKEREQYWIDNTDCVNKYNCFHNRKHSDKKYLEKNKDKRKELREINKDKIKEYKQNNYINTVVKNCLDDIIKQIN